MRSVKGSEQSDCLPGMRRELLHLSQRSSQDGADDDVNDNVISNVGNEHADGGGGGVSDHLLTLT